MIMPKSGMAQMLESMIPDDVKHAIQKAKVEIPAFADALNLRVTRIEESLSRIESLLQRLEFEANPSAAEQMPETLKKVLEQMPTSGQERTF